MLLESLRDCCDQRVFHRVHDLVHGLLRCQGRSTVTGMIRASGRDQQDWSADYRVFSRRRFEPEAMFGLIEQQLVAHLAPGEPVVVAVDDTNVEKSGFHIPGVAYRRDPMSPPFQANLIPAQRFIQASMSIPINEQGACRAFPIAFRHAPSVPRPPKKAGAEAFTEYRRRSRVDNLSSRAVTLLADCRTALNASAASGRRMITLTDGSYTNRTVLRNLPADTTLIGRVRKDAVLFFPPSEQPLRGRKRSYGNSAPTPDQLRLDETVPWQPVRFWASGESRTCEVKTIDVVLSPMAGPQLPLRLVVVRPLRYRLSKHSKLLYRHPAYLICTDPALTAQQVVQLFARRWDIEVNHRDEKQLIGVGQAQVRNPDSAELLPAFAVASYSLMLLAAAQTYGYDATVPPSPPPRWRLSQVQNQPRLTTGQILEVVRTPDSRRNEQPNFSDFESHVARHLKRPKSEISHEFALKYAMS